MFARIYCYVDERSANTDNTMPMVSEHNLGCVINSYFYDRIIDLFASYNHES